jgi:hypothetical protein
VQFSLIGIILLCVIFSGAATGMATRAGTFTNLDMAAFDDEAFAMDEGVGQLVSGRIVNTGYRRARHIDLSGTLFLRQADPVDEADDFIFVNAHDNHIV